MLAIRRRNGETDRSRVSPLKKDIPGLNIAHLIFEESDTLSCRDLLVRNITAHGRDKRHRIHATFCDKYTSNCHQEERATPVILRNEYKHKTDRDPKEGQDTPFSRTTP